MKSRAHFSKGSTTIVSVEAFHLTELGVPSSVIVTPFYILLGIMEDSGPVIPKVKNFISCPFIHEVSSVGPIMICPQDVINLFFPYTVLDD
jgi:hypothetical protein